MKRTAEEAAPVLAVPVARLQRLPEHAFVEPVLAERSFERAIGHLVDETA